MERKCGKCNETQDRLALQFVDLLEDESSKCQMLYCENCLKRLRNCACGRRPIDHQSTFKHRSIIQFEKEQKERKQWRDKKFVPQILKEIIIGHMNEGRRDLSARATNLANGFEDKKLKQEHTLVGRSSNREKQLPKFLGQAAREGDGKVPSGYRTDLEKGIKMIVEAFRGLPSNFA